MINKFIKGDEMMSKDNGTLTSKQRWFCEYYLQSYNATKAYRQAYPNVKYTTAERNGHRLLRNAKINRQIVKIRKQQITELHCNRLDVLQRLIEMFFADVGDYVSFGHHLATDRHGHRYQRSYLTFKNSDDVDTSLIQSISHGQNGNRIELPNKLQLGALLMQYLPSPPNMDIHKDTLVVALEKGLQQYGKDNDKADK